MIFEDESQLEPGDVYDHIPYFDEYFEDEFDCEVIPMINYLDLFCIKDNGVGTFGSVMCFPNDVEMRRFFQGVINDPSCKYSYMDLDMYHFGKFDRVTGVFDIEDDPVLVLRGKDVFEGV